MALVDAEYRFLFCSVGAQGRVSDGGVFGECDLKKALDNNTLGLPDPVTYPQTSVPKPFVIVADEAFPLREYLLKPYPQRQLSYEQRIYNYRLSRARRCVENAFGIMSSRFRVYLRPICISPERAESVVLATCTLHNYLRSQFPTSYTSIADSEEDHRHVDGIWREEPVMPSARVAGRRSATVDAKKQRDELCQYFNSVEGAVAWQDDMVFSH